MEMAEITAQAQSRAYEIMRKRIEDTGSIVVGNTPQQFTQQIAAEYGVYKKVVDSAKLRLD